MPALIEKTVFISYRRTNASWALAISQYLENKKYDVFIDFESIGPGSFARVITENIKARAHFLVLLAPSALERCDDPKDWLRREIEMAMEYERNIIPILLEGFDFGAPDTTKYLIGKLESLKEYNGLDLPAAYFKEGMQRLCKCYLNIPLSAVLHPVSETVQKVNEEQKLAVAAAEPVTEHTLTAQEWFERAFQAKEPEEQIRLYSKGIALDEKYAYAYNNRGYCYNNLGQYNRAIEDYDQAIRLNPEFAGAYNNRGNSYAQLKQYERAIEDYDQAIKFNPEYVKVYNNRGVSYRNLKKYEQAIENYDQAINLNPEFGKAYSNRGVSYAELKQFEQAIEDYDQAIKLNSEFVEAYYNKACAHALMRNVSEALVWLRETLTRKTEQICQSVRTDTDFDGIRDEPAFRQLLEEFCGCA
jgi:tetratricopeptide (TPR) repeat protein